MSLAMPEQVLRLSLVFVLACFSADCMAPVGPSGGARDGAFAAILSPPQPTGYVAIAGSVVIETRAARLPVAFENVGLYRGGALTATASTDGRGRFRFLGLIPNGAYEVRVLSDRWRGTARVLLVGRPRRDVMLVADVSSD
jgi:hypothetical protein